MKTLTILLFCIGLSLSSIAQSLSVSTFKLLDTDLTANTAGTMELDQNGETAALIKVVTTQAGFTFDGGALGIVKTVQKPSEIWVYVPRGLKKLTISHPQLGMLRDYYLNIPIEAARTYEMILIAGEVQTVVKQARTSQYVVFQFSPPNAVVDLDGELLETTDGTATKLMKFGTYNYIVQAPYYLSEAGSITVNDPKNKHVVNICLKPNFSVVTLTVDNGAEIWVNGERRGVSSWTGNLGAGTYEFETRKPNHRNVTVTRDIIATTEPQIIPLQAPVPILGEAEINSTPAMADIYIDGKIVGQTPMSFPDLLIGQHQIRISKQGYKDYSVSFDVKEAETTMLSTSLEKLVTEGNNVTTLSNISSTDSIRTYAVGNVSFKMILVDGGTFTMGATKDQYHFTNDDKPAHQVILSSYYIGETEVTQKLWKTVMGKNPSDFKGDDRPVEKVSWKDCQSFIKKLNKRTGMNFRLPTEAEWEFAARGGNKSQGFEYSGSNNPDEVGWFHTRTHDVKTKLSNELGLFDMSGNVSEWCQDWYDGYSSGIQTNPTGPPSGLVRVNRGGNWRLRDDVPGTPLFHRNVGSPDSRVSHVGLRLAF